MSLFLKNYFSTIFYIIILYLFYSQVWYYKDFLITNFQFKFIDLNINSLYIFQSIILLYIILLVPFYYKNNNKSKALTIIDSLFKKNKNNKEKENIKTSFLALLVKWFFAPLMIIWLTWHIITTLNNIYLSYNDISFLTKEFYLYFNKHFFWLFLSIILFFDVLFFTLWYLIESDKLNNKIKSVDSSFIWWFVVLLCYPPFNIYTTNLIWWYSSEFPSFNNEYIHITLNILILILMWIYSWSSISLWLKASNLTNRWIIVKWPYKYIRHPAYITKNIAWWIWWLPLLIWNFYTWDYKNFFIVLFSLIAWTFIYCLRAITEEKHLSNDSDYLKYKDKVKYKFIPKIY